MQYTLYCLNSFTSFTHLLSLLLFQMKKKYFFVLMFFVCFFLFDIVLSLTVSIKNVCNIENNFLSQRVCKGLRDNVLTVG